jgi:hypothetical protein
MKRDRDTDGWLTVASWLPIRIWEHEDPAEAARRLVGLVCEGLQRCPSSGRSTRQ